MNVDDKDLSALIRQQASRHAAPEALRAGIRTQVALAAAGRGEGLPRRRPAFGWGVVALASFALGVACTLLLVPLVQRVDLGERIEVSLVTRHVHALQVGPLAEIAASDRHVVKPWFQGKLDYAPPVHDFAADGFALVGGRIEYLRGQAVAGLAYTHKRHVIDVFVWPSTLQHPVVRGQHKGFNVLQWADGSMQYGAVSDLESGEMQRFVQLWQARAATQ